MNNPKTFLESIVKYDLTQISDVILKDLEPVLSYEGFTYENM